MAKGRGGPEGTGKIKFRFVEFEMDGTDTTLEEGLKSIAVALSRGMSPAGAAKLLRHNGAETLAPAAGQETPAEEEVVEEEETESTARAARTPRVKKVVPRRVIPDFKLDDVEPTFREFAEEKDPKSDLSKYLVIAYWAKEHKKIDELTPDHFYTAYKYMGWTTPKDPAQPIRDLVHPRNSKFSKPETVGNGRINHVGENAVMELGKK